MSTDQEQNLRIIEGALRRIVHRAGDCDYYDTPDKERPKPCTCARCVAIAALEAAKNWRFHGAHNDRVDGRSDSFPREMKMHAAWKKWA